MDGQGQGVGAWSMGAPLRRSTGGRYCDRVPTTDVPELRPKYLQAAGKAVDEVFGADISCREAIAWAVADLLQHRDESTGKKGLTPPQLNELAERFAWGSPRWFFDTPHQNPKNEFILAQYVLGKLSKWCESNVESDIQDAPACLVLALDAALARGLVRTHHVASKAQHEMARRGGDIKPFRLSESTKAIGILGWWCDAFRDIDTPAGQCFIADVDAAVASFEAGHIDAIRELFSAVPQLLELSILDAHSHKADNDHGRLPHEVTPARKCLTQMVRHGWLSAVERRRVEPIPGMDAIHAMEIDDEMAGAGIPAEWRKKFMLNCWIRSRYTDGDLFPDPEQLDSGTKAYSKAWDPADSVRRTVANWAARRSALAEGVLRVQWETAPGIHRPRRPEQILLAYRQAQPKAPPVQVLADWLSDSVARHRWVKEVLRNDLPEVKWGSVPGLEEELERNMVRAARTVFLSLRNLPLDALAGREVAKIHKRAGWVDLAQHVLNRAGVTAGQLMGPWGMVPPGLDDHVAQSRDLLPADTDPRVVGLMAEELRDRKQQGGAVANEDPSLSPAPGDGAIGVSLMRALARRLRGTGLLLPPGLRWLIVGSEHDDSSEV